MKDRSKKYRPVCNATSPNRFDPSRTGALRRGISAELNRRFALLKGSIVKLLVHEDSLGLLPSNHDPFALNVFCPTGKGGGRDPSCGRDMKGALRALKEAPRVKMKATDAGAPREAVLQRGNLMNVPGNVDHSVETHRAKQAVLDHPQVKETVVDLPISSITPVQKVVSKDSVKHFIQTGDRQEESYELPVVVKLPDGRHILHDGTHRYTADSLSGVTTIKVQMWHIPNDHRLTTNAPWRFNPDAEKVRLFQEWLRQQLGRLVNGKTEEELWRIYTEQGLRKGMGRAYDDTNKKKKTQKTADFYSGSQDEFLRSAFNKPEAVEKVQFLASRTFDEIQGLTNDMVTQLSRTLSDGLVQKKTPIEIARDISVKLDMSRRRAETIARTEIIRAHAEGQLIAFEALGVEELGVAVEWSTAGDGYVCPLCRPLEGVVFKVSESRGMIPRHPKCRCVWLPANLEEETEGQIRTQAKIIAAVKASRRREGKKSKWKPAKPISKVRNRFCPTGPGGGVDPTCSSNPPVSTEVYRKLSVEDRSRITKVERDRTALRKKIKETGGTEEQILKEKQLSDEYKALSDKARGSSASHDITTIKKSNTPVSGLDLQDLKKRTGVNILTLMRDAETSSGSVMRHGMGERENMVGVDLHIGSGKSIRVSYPTSLRTVAAETVQNLRDGHVHPTLLAATHGITFTTQKSKHDAKWAALYGITDLVSHATGGDGHMVVYNGDSAQVSTIAHECGHNLATKLWGSTRPPDWSRYAEVQREEPPISEYGSKSPDEDFAEIAKYYTLRPAKLEQRCPKKYKIFRELLGEV